MSETPTKAGDPFAELLRGSVWPTLVVGVVCVVVGVISSPKAGWSAAIGTALVIGFFGASLLVMKATHHMEPTAVMMVVMASYTAKIVLLGVAMFVLGTASWVSGFAVGVTITATALVWMFFELRAYRRLRIFAFTPDEGGEQ